MRTTKGIAVCTGTHVYMYMYTHVHINMVTSDLGVNF